MASPKRYNSLKLKLGRFFLERKLRRTKRNVQVCPIHQAKTVGITFVVNSPNDLENIRKYLKKLNDHGITTYSMGYIPVKKPHDFYLSQDNFNFFSDKELDWQLRPKSTDAIDFVNHKFDILIDMGTINYFPMYYLVSSSQAKFKVGLFDEHQPVFDFMINIDKKAGYDYYFDQVLHYLAKIN